ncbi:hypothetical protein [Mycoplasma leonicaptivi]|uniref:hypothetical protein n=1 Tax=Mycoplasma leonicaptivi TaxID=36742 RepID=UPI0005612CFA|nr:hypothetical protein [Mycoplasma leonicaptivi]
MKKIIKKFLPFSLLSGILSFSVVACTTVKEYQPETSKEEVAKKREYQKEYELLSTTYNKLVKKEYWDTFKEEFSVLDDLQSKRSKISSYATFVEENTKATISQLNKKIDEIKILSNLFIYYSNILDIKNELLNLDNETKKAQENNINILDSKINKYIKDGIEQTNETYKQRTEEVQNKYKEISQK